MKILIAGLGSIGRRHLRNLLAAGEKDILLYRTHHSTLPETELAGFPVETDLRTALDHQPEAVIVSNPTALHLEVAIPAAEAGCHLLLEKPVSHSLEGLDRLQAAIQRSGSRVLVGFQFRFHPALQQVHGLLSQGKIGRPLSVRAHWGEYLPGWHPWEDYRQGYSALPELGGGVILTLSHPLDYLHWLIGEISSVWAFAGQLNDLEMGVEDTAEIGLRFSNGVLGSVHLDYNQRPSAHYLEIVGAQGCLCWDNVEGSLSLAQPPALAWEKVPIQSPGLAEGRAFERNDMFLAEIQHFLAVARGEAEPVCSLESGIHALKVALAALQSAGQGRLIHITEELRV